MADVAVIKEFLVSLGFKIDPSSERRFVDSIGAATTKAVALGAAVSAASFAVVAGVEKIADGLERLYFASKRTGASVENLQATGFAARQMGVDAGAALGTVENLAKFLRNSPGGEGFLRNLGVQTRDANGHMRDTVDMMGDIGKKLAAMPFYRANAYAQALGIDEKTLMAMREGMGDFQAQYKDMLRSAGTDSQEAAKSSHAFMMELRLLGASVGVLAQKIVGSLTGNLTTNIRRLRETFVGHFDEITATIKTVVGWISRGADAVATMALRGVQAISWLTRWFDGLTPAGQRTVEIIGAVLTAWRVLNAGFLATPVGLFLAAGVAIAALVDDYMTWKDGGKSLIDWSAWEPQIRQAMAGLRELGDVFGKLGDVLLRIFKPALVSIGEILMGTIKTGFGNLLDIVSLITDILMGKWDQAGEKARAVMARTADFAKASFASLRSGVAGTIANGQAVQREGAAATPAPAPALSRSASGKLTDTRGIRNFNPGNINAGDWARAHGSTGVEAGPNGRFATFANAQAGLDALGDLLRGKGYVGGGRDTIAGIIEKYAPRKDNNDTDAYIRMVAKRMGVGADAHLDPRNMQQMAGLIDGIVRVENGKNPYGREMIDHAAARGVALNQTTTITVNGAGDAHGVAQTVSRAQNDVNGQFLRNTRGAVLQ